MSVINLFTIDSGKYLMCIYRILINTVIILGLFFLAGCASAPEHPPEWLPSGSDADETPYVLRASDHISIISARWSDLNIDVKIDSSGDIQYPYIGKVHLDGLTLDEARQSIERELAPYYKIPRLTVNLMRQRDRYAYVLGSVARPGKVKLDAGSTIVSALGSAGGHTDDAELANIAFMRTGEGKTRAALLDLTALEDGSALSNYSGIRLEENDVIYIPKSTIASIEKFFIRVGNIVSPIVGIERGIILYPEVEDALDGNNDDNRGVIVSP